MDGCGWRYKGEAETFVCIIVSWFRSFAPLFLCFFWKIFLILTTGPSLRCQFGRED